MSRYEHTQFAECQPPHPEPEPPIPEFTDYAKGDSFYHKDTRYDWDRLLGQGLCGEVHRFRATPPPVPSATPSQPLVVVKVEKGCNDQGTMRYVDGPPFFLEAARNEEVYGFGVFSGDVTKTNAPHFVLMKYIEGVTLHHFSPKSMAEMATIFIAAVAAIKHLHENHRMVHGDIKGPNIILGVDGKCYPIDFGLAARCGEKTVGSYMPPREGHPAKICPHIPPECFDHNLIEADVSQDAYALGYLLLGMAIRVEENCDGILPDREYHDVKGIINKLRALRPTHRLPLAGAIALIHVAFLSAVPHSPAPLTEPKATVEEGTKMGGRQPEPAKGRSRPAFFLGAPTPFYYSPMTIPAEAAANSPQ